MVAFGNSGAGNGYDIKAAGYDAKAVEKELVGIKDINDYQKARFVTLGVSLSF